MAEEKELAVLKGRVDYLEAIVGELQYQQNRKFSASVLIIDTYDIQTGEIKKSAKTIQSTGQGNPWRRVSNDNSALFVSHNSAVFLEDSNETGIWPTIYVSHFGNTSLTGKDLVMGYLSCDGDNYYNAGVIPSEAGSLLVVNKQKV